MQFVHYVAQKHLNQGNTPAKSRHYAKIIPNKVRGASKKYEQRWKEHMAAVGKLTHVPIAFSLMQFASPFCSSWSAAEITVVCGFDVEG